MQKNLLVTILNQRKQEIIHRLLRKVLTISMQNDLRKIYHSSQNENLHNKISYDQPLQMDLSSMIQISQKKRLIHIFSIQRSFLIEPSLLYQNELHQKIYYKQQETQLSIIHSRMTQQSSMSSLLQNKLQYFRSYDQK